MKHMHKGASSELRACAWLLDQGYEVFRNVSAGGMIDVVALKDDNIFYFDVKTVCTNQRSHFLSDEQIKANVLALCVGPTECHIVWTLPLNKCKYCSAKIRKQGFCSARCRLMAKQEKQVAQDKKRWDARDKKYQEAIASSNRRRGQAEQLQLLKGLTEAAAIGRKNYDPEIKT